METAEAPQTLDAAKVRTFLEGAERNRRRAREDMQRWDDGDREIRKRYSKRELVNLERMMVGQVQAYTRMLHELGEDPGR